MSKQMFSDKTDEWEAKQDAARQAVRVPDERHEFARDGTGTYKNSCMLNVGVGMDYYVCGQPRDAACHVVEPPKSANQAVVAYSINPDYKIPLVEAVRDVLWGSPEKPLTVPQIVTKVKSLNSHTNSYDLSAAIRVILERMVKRTEAVKVGSRRQGANK